MKRQKPVISADITAKWQAVVDMVARLAGVPSSLIMKTDAPQHAVFISNSNRHSPYHPGQSFRLNEKLYCHGVISRGGEIVVEDATRDPIWSGNDDMEFGMSFYIGLPLRWPDGELFGTICVLDRQPNEQALQFREGLQAFCQMIETDLALLAEVERRKIAEAELQIALTGLERKVIERTFELQEANSALRVLIGNLETARCEYESELRRKIRGLISPNLSKLRHGIGNIEPHLTLINVVETSLNELLGRRVGGVAEVFEILTPAEVQVAQLIILGYSTKDIASRMSRETSTIDFHRNNIRKKLDLNRNDNLRSFLSARP